jgi:hypothetical protein
MDNKYRHGYSTDSLYLELSTLHYVVDDAKESIELIKSELNRRLAEIDINGQL